MEDIRYEDINYFNEEDQKRLARMLMRSRAQSGLSQERVALELGIAKKTVQNWERGISTPTLPQSIAWFRVMKVAAMPYFLQFMFPEMEGTSSKNADSTIRKQLISLIETLPAEGVRQLMYLFYGNHGSSPRAVINMVTAHLQTTMKDRYSHAANIINDYKLSHDMENTVQPDHVQPNMELLDKALEKCRRAVIDGRDNFNIL